MPGALVSGAIRVHGVALGGVGGLLGVLPLQLLLIALSCFVRVDRYLREAAGELVGSEGGVNLVEVILVSCAATRDGLVALHDVVDLVGRDRGALRERLLGLASLAELGELLLTEQVVGALGCRDTRLQVEVFALVQQVIARAFLLLPAARVVEDLR